MENRMKNPMKQWYAHYKRKQPPEAKQWQNEYRMLFGDLQTQATNPLRTVSDSDLIFELISRGFAVAKMAPEELAKEMNK